MAQQKTRTATGLIWRVLAPLAGGFFLSFYYRTLNAILAPHLVADLGLSARALGLLTSVYFFTSALAQVPLGLLMDRYGPRRVSGSMMLVGAVGSLLFGLGTRSDVLLLGRAVMGIGAAGALMVAFQAVVLWFPPARWPALNGWILAAGGLGALAASLPTELVLHLTDWRGLMLGVAGVTVLVAAASFLFVPERPTPARRSSLATQLAELLSVFRSRLFWRLAPLAGTTGGCGLAFQGLWAGPWLKDVGHLDGNSIALYLLTLTVLMTLAFLASGTVAQWLGRRGVTLLQVIGGGILLSILLQLPLLLPTVSGRWLVLIAIGGFANCNMLFYPVLAAAFPPTLTGRVGAAATLLVFFCAFVVQYAIGVVINLFPPVAPGSYPAIAYQTAFALLILVQVVSWLWFLVPEKRRGLNETPHRGEAGWGA